MLEIDKIYNTDFLEGVKNIDDNSIDLIVTDPPYGVEFQNNKFFDDSKEKVFSLIDKWLFEMYRVLKGECHCYIFVPTLELDKWIFSIKKYFTFNNLISCRTYTTNRYLKNNFYFNSQHIIYASKGKAKRLNRVNWIKTSEVWLNDSRNPEPKKYTYHYPSFLPPYIFANIKPNKQIKTLHPNQKSLSLVKNLVLLSSGEGDLVLDPFMGSGTTAVACIITGRRFIGFETNKEFYNIAVNRVTKARNMLIERYFPKKRGK